VSVDPRLAVPGVVSHCFHPFAARAFAFGYDGRMSETKPINDVAFFAVGVAVLVSIVSAMYGGSRVNSIGTGGFLAFTLPSLVLLSAIGVVWLIRYLMSHGRSLLELGFLVGYWGVVFGYAGAIYRWWVSL
jgi:hypothetical protein